jgi:hypothetical protein
MMNESRVDLPDLFRAELDAPARSRLFDELGAHAEVIEVRVKYARGVMGAPLTTLAQARALLDEGTALGVLIRYRYEGELWTDTLMAGGAVTRLVRMRVPLAPT